MKLWAGSGSFRIITTIRPTADVEFDVFVFVCFVVLCFPPLRRRNKPIHIHKKMLLSISAFILESAQISSLLKPSFCLQLGRLISSTHRQISSIRSSYVLMAVKDKYQLINLCLPGSSGLSTPSTCKCDTLMFLIRFTFFQFLDLRSAAG